MRLFDVRFCGLFKRVITGSIFFNTLKDRGVPEDLADCIVSLLEKVAAAVDSGKVDKVTEDCQTKLSRYSEAFDRQYRIGGR